VKADPHMEHISAKYAHSILSRRIISCAMRVHRNLGPGLLESAYRSCLARQLALDGLAFEQEVPIPIRYEGLEMQCAYRADIIVDRSVLLELKAVETLLPIHQAQVLAYLRLSGLHLGLLLNFNAVTLKDGIRRFVR